MPTACCTCATAVWSPCEHGLVSRASLRDLVRHRLQCLLAVSGVALGVAIVIGIQATQLAARDAFSAALEGVFGRATHGIRAPGGDLDEAVLAQVRIAAPELRPAPVLSGRVRLAAAADTRALHLLGIDALSAAGARTRPASLAGLHHRTGCGRAQPRDGRTPGVAPGSRLALSDGQELHVLAVLGGGSGAVQLADDVLLVDLATAQEVLARPGVLSRIELEATDQAAHVAALDRVRAALPAGSELAAVGADAAGARALTRAFFTNLDALSLLALLVGGFMIYNTMAFLTVRRQGLFARLRALGVDRATIARQVAGEALLLGGLGGGFGALLGQWLARQLAPTMTQTVADHYYDTAPLVTGFSPGLAGAGILLALVTALLAALHPALQAAALAPARAFAQATPGAAPRAAAGRGVRAALLLVVAAALLLAYDTQALLPAFAALGAGMLAAMLCMPALLALLLRGAERGLAHQLRLPARLALKSGRRNLGRIAVASAALMAATATSIGVGMMVASFRTAVDDWLTQLLRADYYLAAAGSQDADAPIDPDFATQVRALPGVDAIRLVRRLDTSSAGRQHVTAYDLPPAAYAGFEFVAGDPITAWPAWADGAAVLVSEPHAWHHRPAPGARVTLATPRGPLELPVAGVYRDYGSERGTIAIAWPLYRQHWADDRADGLGVYRAPSVAPSRVRTALEALCATIPALDVWSPADIRARSLAIFDRTFVITDLLTLIATVVAALGMFNALLALHLERAREYAVLRANGFERDELRRYLYAQTAWITSGTLLLAIPLGIAIASLLVAIINVRSFGWSMRLDWQVGAVALPVALAAGAAFAATLYPAARALAIAPAQALRDE